MGIGDEHFGVGDCLVRYGCGQPIEGSSTSTTVPVRQSTLRGHDFGIREWYFGPGDRWLITVGIDDSVRLWGLSTSPRGVSPTDISRPTYAHEPTILHQTPGVASAQLTSTNRWWSELECVRSDNNYRLVHRVWDLRQDPPRAFTPDVGNGGSKDAIGGETFNKVTIVSPDDRWVICNFTGSFRRVRLLKLPLDDPPTSIKMAERDMDFRVSSNGRWLVSGYGDDWRLWRLDGAYPTPVPLGAPIRGEAFRFQSRQSLARLRRTVVRICGCP